MHRRRLRSHLPRPPAPEGDNGQPAIINAAQALDWTRVLVLALDLVRIDMPWRGEPIDGFTVLHVVATKCPDRYHRDMINALMRCPALKGWNPRQVSPPHVTASCDCVCVCV